VRRLIENRVVPPPVNDKRCRHCSLQESCMPAAVGEKARAAEILRTLFQLA
jgi:CRISPR-associated exonuclease Cas4